MKTWLLVSLLASSIQLFAETPPVADIGDRLEIFVDRALIDTMEGTTLQLGLPQPEEISMTFENPWDGCFSAAYMTVIKDGGTVTTKPIRFSGGKLVLNYWTSAGGRIQVELLDEAGRPLPGYRAGDCDKIIGNEIKRTVTWQGQGDLGETGREAAAAAFPPHGCRPLFHAL